METTIADITPCSRRACSAFSPTASELAGYTEEGDPMVRWYHMIITAYGFWLPNDPRGSWSDFVGSWEIYKFGLATTTNEKRSLAHDPHNLQVRLAAKKALKYPPVRFDAVHRRAIGDGFAKAIREGGYCIHALCIGYDHAHAIVARHASRTIEVIARHLKSKATMGLTRSAIHPLQNFRKPDGTVPTPWSQSIWSVFINDHQQLAAAINYVERHAEKENLPSQQWDFVRPV